ncbi:hypothetical protein [Streptomyces sp. NPDC093990]|uniref:hypothetical protein n=1 Tax=Streptomyces sp. NPDC093990 TaxID=3155306 RepID=UPI00343511CB
MPAVDPVMAAPGHHGPALSLLHDRMGSRVERAPRAERKLSARRYSFLEVLGRLRKSLSA